MDGRRPGHPRRLTEIFPTALDFRGILGPSLFRAQQDIVSDIRFNQAFLIFSPANAIDITTYKTERVGFDV